MKTFSFDLIIRLQNQPDFVELFLKYQVQFSLTFNDLLNMYNKILQSEKDTRFFKQLVYLEDYEEVGFEYLIR